MACQGVNLTRRKRSIGSEVWCVYGQMVHTSEENGTVVGWTLLWSLQTTRHTTGIASLWRVEGLPSDI